MDDPDVVAKLQPVDDPVGIAAFLQDQFPDAGSEALQGLTAVVVLSAMGWSPGQGLVSATKPSHQEAIPANTYASPASAGSFNP